MESPSFEPRRPSGKFAGMLAGLLRDLVDFCYPGLCAACRGQCQAGTLLCQGCGEQLCRLESAAACERCGMPLAQAGTPCPFCKDQGIPHYQRIVRLGTFEDPLKDLIHQFKYHGRFGIGEQLAERLLAAPQTKRLLDEIDVIVPVPLHRRRQFSRGYNQAAVLARYLSRRSGKPLVRPLVRMRNTESQTHLQSRAKRFENLRDAFQLVQVSTIKGKRVLIVDDVMTTGATLQTVARALRPARPARLSAVVLAVADPRGRGFQAV